MAPASDIALETEDDVSAGDASRATLDVGLIVPWVSEPWGGRWLWPLSVAAAVAMHLAVALALDRPPQQSTIGADGTEIEAISIDVVQGTALETLRAAASGTAASTAVLADQEGKERRQEQMTEAPDLRRSIMPTPEAAKAETPQIVIPDPTLELDPAPPEIPAVTIAARRDEAAMEGAEAKAQPKEVPQQAAAISSAPTEAQEAAAMGGAPSQAASDADGAAPAATVARAGEMEGFGREVSLAVARSRPRLPAGKKRTGTVYVEFRLTPDGAVSYARTKTSSGDAVLDEASIASIRNAVYPRPPIGSRSDQLTYTILFTYK